MVGTKKRWKNDFEDRGGLYIFIQEQRVHGTSTDGRDHKQMGLKSAIYEPKHLGCCLPWVWLGHSLFQPGRDREAERVTKIRFLVVGCHSRKTSRDLKEGKERSSNSIAAGSYHGSGSKHVSCLSDPIRRRLPWVPECVEGRTHHDKLKLSHRMMWVAKVNPGNGMLAGAIFEALRGLCQKRLEQLAPFGRCLTPGVKLKNTTLLTWYLGQHSLRTMLFCFSPFHSMFTICTTLFSLNCDAASKSRNGNRIAAAILDLVGLNFAILKIADGANMPQHLLCWLRSRLRTPSTYDPQAKREFSNATRAKWHLSVGHIWTQRTDYVWS
ncbi:uncharacterized protein BDR25DRAFT_354490 [Lindgomyces ingoldianus]|uniref:Uncharacterized protein n=1 Tax=Lindgomyces ingoldianus TaxID=673940 RepID=A0ACB6QXD7_9PLEO|nr:uncharacterized protein BDR25DRAFT_354490 [Lindgomyces ingoldianus]KAF2471233.1 hypothetical protein BDR25DRAFT_354490 [Lindgomyces ingoldianus]